MDTIKTKIQKDYLCACALKDYVWRDEIIAKHSTKVYRECTICEDVKEVYKFYVDKKNWKGVRSACISCSKQKYQDTKDVIKIKYSKKNYKYDPVAAKLKRDAKKYQDVIDTKIIFSKQSSKKKSKAE